MPRMYGQPKSNNKKMRPIISTICSPAYNIGKYISKLLNPLFNPTKYAVKNSVDFVNKLKDHKISNSQTILSCDVVSLFTSLPIQATLDYFMQFLDETGFTE